jgi:thioredoxin reductase
MRHDVIVVGGSYAGMAAALQLLRARRTVLVIDAGQRRNRFADASHGFLGQDGVNSTEIAVAARKQLERYPTLHWIDGLADTAEGERDAFTLTTSDGSRYEGRRLLFATGVSDQLPDIDGLKERWGRSVFHCPYCHGYELNRGRIGVIAVGPMSLHQALLVDDCDAQAIAHPPPYVDWWRCRPP